MNDAAAARNNAGFVSPGALRRGRGWFDSLGVPARVGERGVDLKIWRGLENDYKMYIYPKKLSSVNPS